jgi:hypothetical protein
VSNQWDEARRTATNLARLQRSITPVFTVDEIPEKIPLFVGMEKN